VQVSTSATFATTVVDRSGITATSQGVSGLANNMVYLIIPKFLQKA
jgi:hypothetical protein